MREQAAAAIAAMTRFLRKEWSDAVAMLRSTPMAAGDQPSEGKLLERVSAGDGVRQMLESVPVQDFFAKQEAQITNRLLGLPLEDDAGRKNLAVAAQTIRQLRSYLVQVAQDGRLAEHELERLRKPRAESY